MAKFLPRAFDHSLFDMHIYNDLYTCLYIGYYICVLQI